MWRKVRVCLQFLASVVFMAFCFIVALRDQIAKSLIWLPLSVGVGGTGASKQKNSWREACDFLQHSAQLLVFVQSTFQLQAKQICVLSVKCQTSLE